MSHRVVVGHNGPIQGLHRVEVALLQARPGSALAGPTAAVVDGLTGYEDERIHVVMPPGSRPRRSELADVVVHYSRHLDDSQVHPAGMPRRTRLARSLADMATWMPDPVSACAVLAAGVQQRLVRPDALRRQLQRPGPTPHRRLLLLAVDDIQGGAQSLAEIDGVRLCRRARLPLPAPQLVRTDPAGRRRYLDLPWPQYGVVAEIDGALHLRPRTWWADMDRQNELVLADLAVLRFPAAVVRARPDVFIAQVTRALRRGGWAA